MIYQRSGTNEKRHETTCESIGIDIALASVLLAKENLRIRMSQSNSNIEKMEHNKPAGSLSNREQAITGGRIGRAMDVLAQWMLKLGPDGVKCLPIYERLERELEKLSSTESKMEQIRARAKQLQDQTAAQPS